MTSPLPDRFLPSSASESLVVQELSRFYERLLRIDPGVEEILEIEKRFPDEPVLNLACAFFFLFGQTPDAQTQSAAFLDRARAMQDRLNVREQAWLGALALWHERAFDAAASAFEAITAQWPRDLPALKAAEFLYYILGQQASGPRFLAHTQRLADVFSDDPDFLAMHAFAHELCGHAGEARQFAERALEIAPRNPWAQHALEHVLLWEGSPDSAVEMMESWLSGWDQSGRVIHCHNAWHVALMHLDRLAAERAFAVYDEHVWGRTPDLVVEQLDSIAFLWRAEMAGESVDIGRYHAIAPHILPLANTLFMPFVSAHYAYALARAGEKAALEELLARVDERAKETDAEARRVWAPAGRPIVHASAALGRGDAVSAAQWFDSGMPHMVIIGGSDAQDDLFRFAYYDSLWRSGRKSDATAYLSKRLEQKPASPLEQKLLTSR